MSLTFLRYIPNTVEPGHRGDDALYDTPHQRETARVGDALVARLGYPVGAPP